MNMKNLIFTILILTFSQLSFAQQRRFNVGLSYRTYNFKKVYNGCGVHFQYNFKKNFSVRTAINWERTFLQMVHFDYVPALYYDYSDNYYRDLQIPILFRYSFGNRFKVFPELGIAYYKYFKARQNGFVDFSNNNSPGDYQDYSYSTKFELYKPAKSDIILGLGTSYQFNDHWLFSINADQSLGGLIYNGVKFKFQPTQYDYPTSVFDKFYGLIFSFKLDYTLNLSKKSDFKTNSNGFVIENNFLKSNPLFNPPITFNQYKRFDFGVISGIILKRIPAHNDTHDWQTDLVTYGLSFQYNTKKIVSYQIGLDYEKNIYQSTVFHADDGPPIKYNLINRKLSTEHYSVPIVAKATFGNRFIFSTSLGARIVNQLSKPLYKETYYHEFDFGLETPLSSESTRYETPFKTQINLIFGFSFGYSFKERVTLNLDFRKTFKNRNDNIFNSYTINYDLVPSLSLKYNFNLKRNSNFKFSTYKLKFKQEEK